jgi:hypothetical protein
MGDGPSHPAEAFSLLEIPALGFELVLLFRQPYTVIYVVEHDQAHRRTLIGLPSDRCSQQPYPERPQIWSEQA